MNACVAPGTAPKEEVGLLSSQGMASSNKVAMKTAVEAEDDGALDQDKVNNAKKGMTERQDKDGNKVKKRMEAYSDDSKEESKNDEVLLF